MRERRQVRGQRALPIVYGMVNYAVVVRCGTAFMHDKAKLQATAF